MILEPKCEVLWPLKEGDRGGPCTRPVVGVAKTTFPCGVSKKDPRPFCVAFRICAVHRDVILTPENKKYWEFTPNKRENL